ncbi:MAG TPA: DnaJ domain-containing protein [Spirochaetota bacterium]|nr:DnaJ domain-containing protein [Spirochaetota bacterium]HPJ38486.1 DnaJ domain-containing protein [Spirochaetota bacterium]HPQ53950.1 DnaJ domain-containing protein [Spirochaetota bacterium]
MLLKPEILDACNVLFPANPRISGEFIYCLEQSKLREAYRKRVFEVHPDRAEILGLPEKELTERFKEINTAYNKLNEYILANIQSPGRRNNFSEKTRSSTAQYYRNFNKTWSNRRKEPPGKRYNLHIPETELMLGQFLFYNHIISLQTLFDAVAWQRKQRPSFGQIAMEWGILTHADIQNILKKRSFREKFGEYALRNEYITQFQYMAILGKQRQMQKPLGQYFIEKAILSPEDLEKYVRLQKKHNDTIHSR